MYQVPVWLAVAFLALLIVAGIRRIRQRRAHIRPMTLVDDDAIVRIIDHGVLTGAEDDDPLDEEEIRSAEDEFWSESWEEPEPYGR